MQRNDHVFMPMPQLGAVRMPSTNYSPYPGTSYGPTQTSNYGTTSYGSHVSPPSTNSLMDRDMATLIQNLSVTLGAASVDELEVLLQNEDRLNTLIEETPQIKELKKKRNELINDSKAQATSNLSMQPNFEALKERLSEAILLQASKKEEYDILKSKLETMAGSISLDTTLAILQSSAAEKDSASEVLANQLLDCKVQIDEFLEQYISERKMYHLRKIKADKMAELVRRGPQMQQQGQSYYGTGYGRY